MRNCTLNDTYFRFHWRTHVSREYICTTKPLRPNCTQYTAVSLYTNLQKIFQNSWASGNIFEIEQRSIFQARFRLVIIIFSLQLIGFINISFLNFEKKIYTKKNNNIWFSFIVGMAFGFGWTPCIGPILGSILALASTEETIFKAIILLSFYSLGLAIPFILSGYLMQKFLMFFIYCSVVVYLVL